MMKQSFKGLLHPESILHSGTNSADEHWLHTSCYHVRVRECPQVTGYLLTHISLASFLWDIGKQDSRPSVC